MADHAKNQSPSDSDAKKKQAGTVLLTPEELRAISGGSKVGPTQPVNPTPNIVIGKVTPS